MTYHAFNLCSVTPFCFLQHLFLTQQCLNQELTLDLLEKYRHPEKLKSCLVTEDEDMEVLTTLLPTLYLKTKMKLWRQSMKMGFISVI